MAWRASEPSRPTLPAPGHPILCLVTDRRLGAGPLPRRVAEAVAGGVDWVQIREKDLDGEPLAELVEAVRAALRGTAARILVNRRLDVALATGADGVHLGWDAVEPADARALLGPGALIGVSTHDPGEALAAAADPAVDYLQIAPVRPPRSKAPGREPLGLAVLERLQGAGRPVLAQGGIDADTAAAAVAAGAAGVAVTGAILAAGDPHRAAAAIRRRLDDAGTGRSATGAKAPGPAGR